MRLQQRRGFLCNPHLHASIAGGKKTRSTSRCWRILGRQRTGETPPLKHGMGRGGGQHTVSYQNTYTARGSERHDACVEISRIKSGFRTAAASSSSSASHHAHTHRVVVVAVMHLHINGGGGENRSVWPCCSGGSLSSSDLMPPPSMHRRRDRVAELDERTGTRTVCSLPVSAVNTAPCAQIVSVSQDESLEL